MAAKVSPDVADEEWLSYKEYRKKLKEYGIARRAERESISKRTRFRVRTARIIVVFVFMLTSWFAGALVTMILHPPQYSTTKDLSVDLTSSMCDNPPPLGAENISGALVYLRATKRGINTDGDEPVQLSGFEDDLVARVSFVTVDARRSTEEEEEFMLSAAGMASRGGDGILRFLSLGTLWPSAVNVRVTPESQCVRERIWPYRVEATANLLAAMNPGMARRSGFFRDANGTNYACSDVAQFSVEGQAVHANRVGSPAGPLSHSVLVCHAESTVPFASKEDVFYLIVNVAIGILVFVYGWCIARPMLMRWRIRYANRVAPEYSFNTRNGAALDPSDNDDDDDDSECNRDEQALELRLKRSFDDEFSWMQVVEFLLPGSSPIKCDKEMCKALPSSLLQCAFAHAPQPLLLIGAHLLGCNSPMHNTFPNEQSDRCALHERTWVGWLSILIVLLTSVQSLAFFLYSVAYYTCAPLTIRMPLRRAAEGLWIGSFVLCGVYFVTSQVWLLLALLLVPFRAIPLLLMCYTAVGYTVIVVHGLVEVGKVAYDNRGRLLKKLVTDELEDAVANATGIPEGSVMLVAFEGVVLFLAIFIWIFVTYEHFRWDSGIGRVIAVLIGSVTTLAHGFRSVQRSLGALKKISEGISKGSNTEMDSLLQNEDGPAKPAAAPSDCPNSAAAVSQSF